MQGHRATFCGADFGISIPVVQDGCHYHTIDAESEEILDAIQEELQQKGFLAKLQDYEPVDFWGGQE